MAVLALEPGRQPTKVIVLLQQQHAAALTRDSIRRREAGEARTDDDEIVVLPEPTEALFGQQLGPLLPQGGGAGARERRQDTCRARRAVWGAHAAPFVVSAY